MSQDPYNLAPEFERKLVAALSDRPRLYGLLGVGLNPQLLGQETCRLLLRAIKGVAEDIGHGPTTGTAVAQRIRRWVEEGKVTEDSFQRVLDLLADGSDLTDEEAIAEVVPLLKRRAEADFVRLAIEQYGKHGDFGDLQKDLHKIATLGKRDETAGTVLSLDTFDEILRANHLDKIGTSIEELDVALGGGLPRGCLGVWLAGLNRGKSMGLCSNSAYAMKAGVSVAYATLEMSSIKVLSRVKAALTGIPTDSILSGVGTNEASNRLREMLPRLGSFVVQDFVPKVTTVPDIVAWVKESEEQIGKRIDLIQVDYADKLGSHLGRENENEYKAMNTVYECLRNFAKGTHRWVWTASQAKRKAAADRGGIIEADDVADSINKARVCDVMVSINPDQDGSTVRYFITRNRDGRSLIEVGPIPHAFEMGRMSLWAR